MLDHEEHIEFQNNLLNHQDNLLEKYSQANSKIKHLLREHATGRMSSDMVVNYLKMHVDWRD